MAWAESERVVSTGGDGAIVVYEERWEASIDSTTWAIIAHTEAAQGVFEVNHNKWATRRIKSPDESEKGVQDVDLMISTGDDGSFKVENMEP